MNSSRICSFFVFLAAFALFAHGTPLDNGVAIGEEPGNKIVARHYPENPCNCPQDLIDVCVDLRAKIVVIVWLGPPSDPHVPGNQAIDAINVAIGLVSQIQMNSGCTSADIVILVGLLVDIILSILAGCTKWDGGSIGDVCASIDVVLAVFIQACIALCHDILPNIELNVALLAKVVVLITCGFSNTLACLHL